MGRLPTEAACPNAFKACWRIGSGSRSPRWANSMIFFATRYVRGEGPGLPAMTMLIEFFRVRSTDNSHAMGRISVAADDLEAARVKAKPQDALVARCFLSLSMRVKRLFNCHCEMVPAVVICDK